MLQDESKADIIFFHACPVYLIVTVKHTTTISKWSLIWLITCMLFSCGTSTLDHMRGRGLRTKLLHNIEAVLQEHELVRSVMIVLEGVVHQVLLTYYKGSVWLHPLYQSASLSACRGDKEHRFKNGIIQTPMCMEDVIA